jgi:serine/threonine protein kinase
VPAEPQRKTPQFDLPPGTMFGKYEVLRKLAMGGMAEIYLCRMRGNAGFEKLVVVKRILPTVANDPTFVQMFLDEARLAATLQHPNIADVYEVGDHEGAPYFAIEFVHGQDVRSIRLIARERGETVPLAIALAIIHGTASALDYAHDRTSSDGKPLGIVHRDVSTSNVLVGYEGSIKLIDFGIARAASRSHQTQTGTLKGKIPYMSPEQCRGQPMDRRSDLWSLGVLMYEMTVGRRPFRGENDFAIMDQIVHQETPTPSSLIRNYPAELEAIVMKLLTRKVTDRYQTAEQMLHDLDPFLATNRLWVSPKPLSRYMRTVFADRVAAWDKAMEDGVTLAQHLTTSSSSETGQSELVTPPSAFPAVMPLSQEMPAVRPSDTDLGKHLGLAPTAEVEAQPNPRAASEAAAAAAAAAEYPKLKRSGARIAAIAIGIVALAVGGYVAFTFVQNDLDKSPPAPARAPAPAPAAAPAVAPTPAPPPPVKVEAPPPVKVEEPTIPEPVKTPPKKVTPAVVPPKHVVVPPKHATNPPPPKDPQTPPPPKDPKEKDPQWNLDSPFLPPKPQ